MRIITMIKRIKTMLRIQPISIFHQFFFLPHEDTLHFQFATDALSPGLQIAHQKLLE